MAWKLYWTTLALIVLASGVWALLELVPFGRPLEGVALALISVMGAVGPIRMAFRRT